LFCIFSLVPEINGPDRKGATMSKDKSPVTAAVRALRTSGVSYTEHPYAYEEKGGTAVSARELGVDEHCVIKTLIMEDERRNTFIVLMHGDLQVSTKELARIIGVKQITPCTPDAALKQTGYQVGGTSPFGTRKTMPVYMEKTISDLPRIYINGGKRGFLVAIDSKELVRVLNPVTVKVGI
jgi:Cys-tRNA(Pro) deacylase